MDRRLSRQTGAHRTHCEPGTGGSPIRKWRRQGSGPCSSKSFQLPAFAETGLLRPCLARPRRSQLRNHRGRARRFRRRSSIAARPRSLECETPTLRPPMNGRACRSQRRFEVHDLKPSDQRHQPNWVVDTAPGTLNQEKALRASQPESARDLLVIVKAAALCQPLVSKYGIRATRTADSGGRFDTAGAITVARMPVPLEPGSMSSPVSPAEIRIRTTHCAHPPTPIRTLRQVSEEPFCDSHDMPPR